MGNYKWQGYIGWAEADSEYLDMAFSKNTVLVKERLTKHHSDFKDVINELQEIRNDNVVMDFQILTLKIWRIPKDVGQLRVRNLKGRKGKRRL